MQKRKLNILFISSWYPSRVFKYYGDFVKRHAKAAGLYSNVICLHVIRDKKMNKGFEVAENEEGDLKEVIIYFNRLYFIKLAYIFYYIKGFYYIRKKYSKPDLVHANVLYPIGFIAFIYLILFKTNFVVTEHWTGFQKGEYKEFSVVKRLLFNFIGTKATYILPVTDDLKHSMLTSGIKGNFKIIPNVVETDLFRKNKVFDNNKKQILHISHLRDKHKNISGILRVISKLSQIRQDFILKIIHSEENNALVELASSLGILGKYVNFCGNKNYQEVADFMSKSVFLVLFSNFENLPCVIVEALSSGLPVISTDVGGIKEHIDNSKGILIKRGDELALLDAMNYLLDNYNSYNKENLRQYALSNFSYQVVGKGFCQVYSEIINV